MATEWELTQAEKEFEEELNNMPRKVLLKRPIHIRQPEMDKLKVRMTKDNFSILVVPLAEESAMSGPDDERGYLCFVYYEPTHEKQVLNCWKKHGVNLEEKEAIPVDPDDCSEEEYYFMYFEGQIMYVSMTEYILTEP